MPPWGSASRTACWRRRASTRATVSASGSTTGVRALLHTAHCTRTSHRAWHGLRRWYNGLNNAFRYDDSRRNDCGGVDSLSVGLGGNIEASLHELQQLAPGAAVPPRFGAVGLDAGNGSLMRLAAIPVLHHKPLGEQGAATALWKAREVAYQSSLTTHPGPMAAEVMKRTPLHFSRALVELTVDCFSVRPHLRPSGLRFSRTRGGARDPLRRPWAAWRERGLPRRRRQRVP